MSYKTLNDGYRDLRFFMVNKDVKENFEGNYDDMYKTLSLYSKNNDTRMMNDKIIHQLESNHPTPSIEQNPVDIINNNSEDILNPGV